MDETKFTFVDLSLPSGKLWANENVKDENGDEEHFTFDKAVKTFGKNLPSKEDWKELFDNCSYKWNKKKKGFDITGSNGNSIFLPAAGYRGRFGVYNVRSFGFYWSSTVINEGNPYYVIIQQWLLGPSIHSTRYLEFSVRLVR